MYINSLNIEKYQILENLQIKFQIPSNNKNVVNIVAGVNGSGKTTLLKWILGKLEPYGDFDGVLIYNDTEQINNNNENWIHYRVIKDSFATNNNYINGVHSSPRVIYIPSNMTFSYTTEHTLDTTYQFSNTIDTNNLLGNAELFIKNYIISKERLSNKSNPLDRTKDAIDSFNAIFKESELVTKLINLDEHNNNKPIFETLNNEKITIDKLSSGEQQLYARVVSLMILNPHNSIILIDEPEIALHPRWQIEIMKIYANIGKNNQFIVTTHSPFIIAQTPYQNLIFLMKENEKIVAKQFSEAPLDRDINTIVKTIMGANYIPQELEQLRREYRELFDKELETTDEAKDLESKILMWESPNSSFWQSIAFDKELRSI